MIRAVVALAAMIALAGEVAAAVVADIARETRWANEVVPQLVVGDAVWLATPQHPRVLALYTKAPAATRNAVIVVHGQIREAVEQHAREEGQPSNRSGTPRDQCRKGEHGEGVEAVEHELPLRLEVGMGPDCPLWCA